MNPIRKLILIADDHDDPASLLPQLVTIEIHFETVSAKDGAEALVLACERLPDVAVLDIDMPRLNGIDAGRAMRVQLGERRPLLVALTGRLDATEVEFSGCFDHVLLKPVTLATLLPLISKA